MRWLKPIFCALAFVALFPLSSLQENKPLPIPIVEDSQIIFDHFLKIRCDKLLLPNGSRYNYYMLMLRPKAVVVIGITENGEFVLNQEYRHPTGSFILCLPGGCADEGETPVEAAKREFFEETGFSAEEFELIGSTYPNPGLTSQQVYYVIAKGAHLVDEAACRELGEIQHTVLMKRDELNQAIHNSEFIDGNMCTALFFYDLKKQVD